MARSRRKSYATAAQATHILPVVPALGPEQKLRNYLTDLREDSILDGLIGGDFGHSGGGWTNRVTGMGTFDRDKVMQGRYEAPYLLSWPELSDLYNGNDLAKRIVETVPKEMFRRGWVLVVPQDSDPQASDQTPDDGSAALQQPVGGESGPAAPGAPLVDPMGGPPAPKGSEAPDNQMAKVPSAVAPSDDTAAPGAPATGDNKVDPNAQPHGQMAPAAPGAAKEDPMGMALSKAPGAPQPGDAATLKGNAPDAVPGPVDEADEDQSAGADLAIAAEAYAARLQLKARALEGSIFGRLYGGGLLLIGADDGQDMALPLKEDSIKTIHYLSWIDRRFIFASSWYAEIGPKYGEVETWQIVNPFGGQSNTVVHESRVIRFDGAPVDFLMRRRLMGWTLSVLQAPYDTLRQFDQSFQSVANLMSDVAQAYMKMQGLCQMISTDQKTLQTRMQMVDMSRSSGRMLLLDAENEEFGRATTPMTGISDVMQMQMLRAAAAAGQPVAILFGREPSGLNATGDADFRRFYDQTKGTQMTELEPKLRRLYTLIFAAKDGPTSGVVPAKGLEFTWHKLYEPSELEQSEIRMNMATADDLYIGNGTLLPHEVAMSRFRSGDLHLDTEINTDLRDEAAATAQLAPSGAAKAEAEAEQAKDLAVTTAGAKGEAAVGVAKVKGAQKPKPSAAKPKRPAPKK